MRRRRNKSAPTEADPMDEDDQAEVVASLEKEGLKQIESFNKIFGIVCVVAMASTPAVVLIHGGGILQWMHAIYATVIHWLARMYATEQVSDTSMYSGHTVFLLTAVLSPLLVTAAFHTSLNSNDTAHLHWSIALGNLLVAVCSFLLRIETANTLKGINTLESSKYNFKTL